MKIDVRDCKYRLKNQIPKSELIFTIPKSNLKIAIDKWIYMCYNPFTKSKEVKNGN